MDLASVENSIASSTEDQIATETANSPPAGSMSRDGGIDDTVKFALKSHKKISSKESPRTSLNSLNKFKSQIKKPSHRNGSPLNWIPRQKGDTYLKRKIKQLQEASGMSSTLDETLGTANPHYCRLLREKIASREAAVKAIEARKASMVEASWCRILKAARIQSKETEALLSKAEKNAAEALEAASAKGVLMYDKIDCPQKQYVIETPSAKGKAFAHTVKASFETAFEVDRQVASAVKTAFVRLAASCPSSSLNKDEYSGLLRKISENPETDETNQDLTDVTSECETDAGLELESGFEDASSSSLSANQMDEEMKLGMFGRRQGSQRYNKEGLVDIMLGRLKCLKEEELASLATIVATCGLNAALAGTENKHQDRRSSYANSSSRRMSTFGAKHLSDVNLPSLDKCLIKHTTRLEREVQNAQNARKNDSKGDQENPLKCTESNFVEAGLESILVKHSSKLEREKAELKRKIGQISELEPGEERRFGKGSQVKQKVDAVPSLDKCLVKHVSRLEREIQEAKSKRNDAEIQEAKSKRNDAVDVSKKGSSVSSQLEETQISTCLTAECTEKENIDSNKDAGERIGDATVERVVTDKDKLEVSKGDSGLDSALVKHKSKLEREKMAAAAVQEHDDLAAVQEHDDRTNHTLSRQKARERELQEAWGGMSLGNCVKPHMSRLEREKAAWIKEEEEKKAAMREKNKAIA